MILLHLPGGRHTADAVRDALVPAMAHLPAQLRRSLAWDQGKEMALHGQIALALDMPVFFCDKASPWQRPSNENTNGLLRQYFPKGTDLRIHGPDQLAAVAAELNDRPRKTLGGRPRPSGLVRHCQSVLASSKSTSRWVLPAGGWAAARMAPMADLRRRNPEPPPGEAQIQFTPGLANETLRELAPLLAEEGIDVDNIDVPDMDTLQTALNRAVERHNMTRFTPVGHARDLVITALRLVIEAIAEGNTTLGAAILEQVQPESPDNTAATVAGCIGTALGLLDDWLTGSDPQAPKNLGQRVHLPTGHWLGQHAATDILVLARKGRAFRSLDTLITRQGGHHVLYGSALALAASIQTWSAHTGTPVTDLTRAAVR